MRRLILSLTALFAIVASVTWAATARGETPPAEVLVLGVYHMANPGRHTLTRNENEQIGFRVAKDLGHATIYPVDADGDFPLQRVANYARAIGDSGRYKEILEDGWGTMVKELDAYLKRHTFVEALLYVNSEARVARDVALYYQLARFGEPGDYPGPDLLAEWYRRNIRIYSNVAKLVASPEDRILVIYGYGHLGWLRQAMAADQTLRLRRLEEFVTRPRARR